MEMTMYREGGGNVSRELVDQVVQMSVLWKIIEDEEKEGKTLLSVAI